MGSSCSILNDTEFDVWVTHGVNWGLVDMSVTIVAALATVGTGAGSILAARGAATLAARQASSILVSEASRGTITTMQVARNAQAFRFYGLTPTQWSVVNVVSSTSTPVLSKVLDIPKSEAEKLKEQVRKFKKNGTKLEPGEKYTVKATLSLNLKYYVMNEKAQFDQRGCFTGATDKSEKVYPISKYFQNLDDKKSPEDTIMVYQK